MSLGRRSASGEELVTRKCNGIKEQKNGKMIFSHCVISVGSLGPRPARSSALTRADLEARKTFRAENRKKKLIIRVFFICAIGNTMQSGVYIILASQLHLD